jgi:hypothetical protein
VLSRNNRAAFTSDAFAREFENVHDAAEPHGSSGIVLLDLHARNSIT